MIAWRCGRPVETKSKPKQNSTFSRCGLCLLKTLQVDTFKKLNPFIAAWSLALLFYVLEYATRSAPAVMIPNLSASFHQSAAGIGALLGAYYYTYSITSLVAGIALDKVGARTVVPFGCALLGVGCLAFTVETPLWGYCGRLLQGAGSSFAFTGAVYFASRGFSARSLATAVGVTQCLGMLGGSAGQFVVGPVVGLGTDWQIVWYVLGAACLLLSGLLLRAIPNSGKAQDAERPMSIGDVISPFRVVLSNPQAYLCGLIAGLLFVPTTIGDMTWGVSFFEFDKDFSFQHAVTIVSMVPLGWAVGCPLIGWLADFVGSRKPVLLGGGLLMFVAIAQIVIAPGLMSPLVSMFVFGVASGAAMIPFTIIKEANPDGVKGSATGIQNFIVFGISAGVGPVFGNMLGKTLSVTGDHNEHFRHAGTFWLVCTGLALVACLFLRETGRRPAADGQAESETVHSLAA